MKKVLAVALLVVASVIGAVGQTPGNLPYTSVFAPVSIVGSGTPAANSIPCSPAQNALGQYVDKVVTAYGTGLWNCGPTGTNGAWQWWQTYSNASGSRQLCHSGVLIAQTGNTTANNVFSCSLPAGTIGLNSRIDIRVSVTSQAGNVANCSYNVRMGPLNTVSDASIMADGGFGASAFSFVNGSVHERNSASAQVIQWIGSRNTSIANQSVTTLALSNASAQFINVWLQNGNSADTCNFQAADITLWP
jgi:hypothetical protein